MKLLLKFYVSLVVIFMAAKLCFMAFNVAPDGAVSAADRSIVLVGQKQAKALGKIVVA